MGLAFIPKAGAALPVLTFAGVEHEVSEAVFAHKPVAYLPVVTRDCQFQMLSAMLARPPGSGAVSWGNRSLSLVQERDVA